MAENAVWVVEQGEYSDYRVVGVFSSQEHAERVADAINDSAKSYDDTAMVAEWPLDPVIEELNHGRRPYEIWMQRDGSVTRCERYSVASMIRSMGRCYILRGSQRGRPQGVELPDVLEVTLWAKDEAHAIKIVNEKRAQLIAAGEWEPEAVPNG